MKLFNAPITILIAMLLIFVSGTAISQGDGNNAEVASWFADNFDFIMKLSWTAIGVAFAWNTWLQVKLANMSKDIESLKETRESLRDCLPDIKNGMKKMEITQAVILEKIEHIEKMESK